MDNSKPWYESQTVWSDILTIAMPMLGWAGYQISPADVQALVGDLAGLATVICGLWGIYGRLTATKKIGAPNA